MNNAVKRLSGNYWCVVEFLGSGAKLETPHELIKIVGEYHEVPYTRLFEYAKCQLFAPTMHQETNFIKKTLPHGVDKKARHPFRRSKCLQIKMQKKIH